MGQFTPHTNFPKRTLWLVFLIILYIFNTRITTGWSQRLEVRRNRYVLKLERPDFIQCCGHCVDFRKEVVYNYGASSNKNFKLRQANELSQAKFQI